MGVFRVRTLTMPSVAEAQQTRNFNIIFNVAGGVNQVLDMRFVPNGSVLTTGDIEFPSDNLTSSLDARIKTVLEDVTTGLAYFSVTEDGGYVSLVTNTDVIITSVILHNKDWNLEYLIANTFETSPPTKGLLLSRSNYYLNLDFAGGQAKYDVNLWFRFGNENDTMGPPTYQLEKVRPSYNTDDVGVIISNFANDFLQPKPINSSTTGVKDSIEGSVLLTYAEIVESGTQNRRIPITKKVTTKGKTSYFDGYNASPTQNILLSSRNQRVPKGEALYIPFLNNGVKDTVNLYDNFGNLIHTFGIPAGSEAKEKIKYLVFDTDALSDTVRYLVTDDDEFIFYIEKECKYRPTKCAFLNRFGVYQYLYFFKSVKKSIETSSETFKNAYIENGAYDPTGHQYKEYNKNGRKSVTLTSGFVTQDENTNFEELLMSEDIYLVDFEQPYTGVLSFGEQSIFYLPVNIDTKSLDFQNRIDDKLITYDIKFKYSFDEINRI